jgi:hypothetical protein
MSTMPPQNDEPEDIDSQYRRWSAADSARPADSVGKAVLAQAARLAAERNTPATRTRRRSSYGWRSAVFGGLAAATLAGLLVTPRFFSSDTRAVKPGERAAVSDAQMQAAKPATPPAVASVPQTPSPHQAAPSEKSSTDAKSRRELAVPAAPAYSAPAAAASSNLDEVIITGQSGSAQRQVSNDTDKRAMAADKFTASRAEKASDRGDVLRQSAESGDRRGLELLLDEKVDIEGRDSSGRTALMLAVLNGQDAIVSILLARGADPNATDAYGETPLHTAVAGNHPGIAAALQQAGAR